MDNQKYGMLFETSPNSHYYFDAGTGKVITCSTEERDFIEKVLDGTLSLEKAKEINTEFKDFLDEENSGNGIGPDDDGWLCKCLCSGIV